VRRRKDLLADFSNLPAAPSFADVSAIGRMAVTEFETGNIDEVYLVYTDFVNMARQIATTQKLLPLELSQQSGDGTANGAATMSMSRPAGTLMRSSAVTALQVYRRF
jgi:F-type H+-transporting ATPase subunit gamma